MNLPFAQGLDNMIFPLEIAITFQTVDFNFKPDWLNSIKKSDTACNDNEFDRLPKFAITSKMSKLR